MNYRTVDSMDQWLAALAEAEAIPSRPDDEELVDAAQAARDRVERALDEAVAVAEAKTESDQGAIDDVIVRLKSALEPLMRVTWPEVLRRMVERATAASKAEDVAELTMYYAATEKSVADREGLFESRVLICETIRTIEERLVVILRAAKKSDVQGADIPSLVWPLESRRERLAKLVRDCERY